MTQRIDYQKQSPELFKKMLAFSLALNESTIEQSIRHLVDIQASQLNGCAFCVDMHVKEATMHGERPLRLHHVAIWRESTLFSPRERAALEWAEILTRIPAEGVPGTKVLITGRHEPHLEATAAEHPNIAGLVADAARPDDTARTVAKAIDTWGRLDVLANNAGAGAFLAWRMSRPTESRISFP